MTVPGAQFKLTSTEEAKLVDLLDEQLSESLAEHELLESALDENHLLWMAEPAVRQRNFPWRGSSNVVIPLIGTTVDSIHARVVNTIFGVEPFWTCRALHKSFAKVAKPVENFMDWSRKVEFDLYREVKSWALEIIQDGQAWMKVPWEVSVDRYFDPVQKRYIEDRRRRPNPQHVLLNDIIIQAGVGCADQAEWKSHRVRVTDTELAWRAYMKVFTQKDVDTIIDMKEDISPDHDRASADADTLEVKSKLNTLHEMWCTMPIPGRKGGPPEAFVATYHKPTKKILRIIHNPNMSGSDNLIRSKFVEVKGKDWGLGIARMLRGLQAELTTIHNQQVDNATLANTRFFVGRRNQVREGTRIWPGRVLTVSDPDKDLKTIQLGDVYESMYRLEISVNAIAEKRTGITDYALGRESSVLGSRATATGTLAVLQEGNRRFDLNIRDMRSGLGKVGSAVLQLNQQFRKKGIAYFVQGEEEGQYTEFTLDLPREFVRDKLGIELTASTATINRQVEQQGLIALLGTLLQNLQVGQQAAMVIANPQVPAEAKEFTAKAFDGITEIVKRIAGTFDQKDADMLVPAMMGAIQDGQNGGPTQVQGPQGAGIESNGNGAMGGVQ